MLLSSYIIVFKITYCSFQFLHQSIFYYKNTLWQKVLFRDCRQQPSVYIERCFHHITLVIHHSPLVITSLFHHYNSPFEGKSARAEYVNRGMLSPSAYGLRPSASSSFFRLETSFLPFFVSLYYAINQLFIYPSYTNRPRFV